MSLLINEKSIELELQWNNETFLYPCQIHIIDESKGIDKKFFLDDLKDIQSGITTLTEHEKKLIFQALLGYYVEQGDQIYENFIEQANEHGLSRDHVITRAKGE